MFPGGGAANVAVHSSRFGAEAGYVGVIGSDLAGRHVADALATEGVDLSHARFFDEPNSTTDVQLDSSGNRYFVAYKRPLTQLKLGQGDLDYLTGATWLYSSYSGGIESEIARMARIAPVAYDFAHKDQTYVRELIANVTFAAFSRDDLSEDECVDFVRSTQSQGPRVVIITRGRHGAVIGVGSKLIIQAAKPTDLIDTLGAGDAFLARFVNGLMSDEDPVLAAQEASIWAAKVCSHFGAFGHPAGAFADFANSEDGQQ